MFGLSVSLGMSGHTLRRGLSGLVSGLGLLSLVSCAHEPKAAPPPVYAPPPAPPPTADNFLRVPAAAAPAQPPPWLDLTTPGEPKSGWLALEPERSAWSEKAYLALTAYGVLALDLERGMRGLIKIPKGNVAAALLVGDGSTPLLANDEGELYRAKDLDAAVKGEFELLSTTAGAQFWDARGKFVVIKGEQGENDKLWISQDQGKTFREGPALPPDVRKIVVRRDGVMAVEVHDFKIWVSDGWRPFAEAKLKPPETGENREFLAERGVLERWGDAIVAGYGCPEKTMAKSMWNWMDSAPFHSRLVTAWPGEVVEPTLPKVPTAASKVSKSDCVGGLLGVLSGRTAPRGAFALEWSESSLPTGKRVAVALGDAACSPTDSEERVEKYTVLGTGADKQSHEETHKYRVCKQDAKLKRWGSVALVTSSGLNVVPVTPGCHLESVSTAIGLGLFACRNPEQKTVSFGVVGATGLQSEVALPGTKVERLHGHTYAADGTLVVEVELDGKTRHFLRSPAQPGAGRWRSLPAEAIAAKALAGGRALVALPGVGGDPNVLNLVLDTPQGLAPLPSVALTQNAVAWAVTGDGRVKLWLHPRLTRVADKPAPGEQPALPFWVSTSGTLIPADQ
ncbi:MAG: hypothetical protein H6718_01315 [Polyangiaceae bacterium]|nr:hypothetical protein [Polyangiaceae bacterium]